MQTVTFQHSIYNVTLNEKEIAEIYADYYFLRDVVLAVVNPVAYDNSDLPHTAKMMRQYAYEFFKKETGGYCKDFIDKVFKLPAIILPEGWIEYPMDAPEVKALDDEFHNTEDDANYRGTPPADPIVTVCLKAGYWICKHESGNFSTLVNRESEYGSFADCLTLLSTITDEVCSG